MPKTRLLSYIKKVEIFRNFIQLKYFKALEIYFEITVDLIRDKIKKTINEFFQLNCIDDSYFFLSNRSLFLFSINFVSMLNSFFFKFLKMRSKSKKIAKILTAVKKNIFIRQTAAFYEINKQIVVNRISKKHDSEIDNRKN